MAGIDLSTIVPATIGGAGAGGFIINGQCGIDYSGASVASAGDVNGDGFDDLIIGAFRGDPIAGPADAGRSYVVFGRSTTTATNLSAITAGTGGFVINGHCAGDFSGYSVAGAGDINGDGLADLIVGALLSDLPAGSNIGRSYVVFGQTAGTAINLAAIANGTGGFVINGQCAGDYTGYSAANAGDVNGDGLADLIVGAFGGNLAAVVDVGRSYVVFGRTAASTIELSAIAAGTGGFVINGQCANDYSGTSVSSAGDINGDGLADLIIGAPKSDPTAGADAGRSYVVFGRGGSTPINLSAIANGTGGFVINGQCAGDNNGHSVANAGDVNGDGLSDLLVGSHLSDPAAGADAGRSYVVFGQCAGTAINLATVAGGTGGFVINGQCLGDNSGRSVASAGDINGDGLSDLIIGAWKSDPTAGTLEAGRSYVVFGKTTTAAINLSAVALGTGGFVINGQDATDLSGGSVASAGDVNGDGLADLIVGASASEVILSVLPTTFISNAGRSYVIFGSTTGVFATTTVDQLGGSVTVTLTGTSSTETLVGGSGNNTLNALGGADVLYGGAGNDRFTLIASNIAALSANFGANGNTSQLARIDGGAGIDTLVLSGAGLSLDLTTIANQGGGTLGSTSRIESIERIDLTGSGNNSVTLSVKDVLDMAGDNSFNNVSFGTGLGATVARHQLVIDGNAGDSVVLSDAADWTRQGSPIINGANSYKVFNHNSAAAQVLVDTDVTINLAQVNAAPTGALNITGTATQGQTLTASIGTLVDTDGIGALSLQWKAGGINIPGATGITLVPSQAEVGKTISIAATYTDLNGTAESAGSNVTAAVTNVNDAPTGAVGISGIVAARHGLGAHIGSLTDLDGLSSSTVLTYQWQSSTGGGAFSNISGANGATLFLTEANIGNQYRVIANYTDGQGASETSTSPATAPVAAWSQAAAPTVTKTTATGTVTFSAADAVTFMSGITPDGKVAATAYKTWTREQIPKLDGNGEPLFDANGEPVLIYNPVAKYETANSNAVKWGSDSTNDLIDNSTPGTSGGTVTYWIYTDPAGTTPSADTTWTLTEKKALVSSLKLWSALIDINFAEASTEANANLVYNRIVGKHDAHAAFGELTSFTAKIGGTAEGHAHDAEISIDPAAYGFEVGIPLEQNLVGNSGWETIIHEASHMLGVGHGGPYNGDLDTKTQQFSVFDTKLWASMSYIEVTDKAKFSATYPISDTAWYGNKPTTPMMLDILAAQRMYGAPANGPLSSGGQIFGFNSNIDSSIRDYFDFTKNKIPVVTLWDGGANNTLDLSVSVDKAKVNLNPGTFSSAFRMKNNIAIAQDTIIETVIGGSRDDVFTGSGVDNTFKGNGGNDTLKGGAGTDRAIYSKPFAAYDIADVLVNGVAGVSVTDRTKGGDGKDTLFGIEKLVFTDLTHDVLTSSSGDDFANGFGTSKHYGGGAINRFNSGSLEVAGDRDWFAVQLDAGTTYAIDLLGAHAGNGSLANPFLRLYDGNGILIPPPSDDVTPGSNLDSRLTFTPTTPGANIYYLEASASGDSATGTYNLKITPTTLPDEQRNNFSDLAPAFGAIAPAATTTASLEIAGDRDWFKITLTRGLAYAIKLQGSQDAIGTLEDPLVRIYAANGEFLDENDDDESGAGADSLLSFSPGTTGIYYIEAAAFDDDGRGTYRLSVGAGTVPLDDFASSFYDTQLPLGQVQAGGFSQGKLEIANDRDWFAVVFDAGSTYTIKEEGEYAGLGTLIDPFLRLYQSDGTFIDPSNDDIEEGVNRDSLLTYTAAKSGTYYIEAGAFNDVYTGTYTVSVARTNQRPTVANPIADRSTPEDSLFSFVLPANTFIDGDLGDGLTFTATKTDGSLLPAWLGFNATTLSFSGTPTNADVGVVNVRVSAKDSKLATISEDFALTVANTNDAPIASSFVNRNVVAGQSVSYNLKTAFSDVDVGDSLTYSATGLPTGVGINPTTGVISGTTTSTTGVFHIVVKATDASAVSASLTFDLSVSAAISDDMADSFSDTTAPMGQVQAGFFSEGELETKGDRDWFAIPLDAGSSYQINLQGVQSNKGTLADPHLRFYQSNHLTFVSNDNIDPFLTDSMLTVTPTASGIYFVSAGASADNYTGTYTVSVTRTNQRPTVANPLPDRSASEESAFSFTVPTGTFADTDVNDPRTLSASKADGSALPVWLTFNTTTRIFSGTPANADVGAINVRVTAKDSHEASISDDFVLTVINTNDAPTAAFVSDRTYGGGQSVSLNMAAAFSEVDVGDSLRYAATGLPSGFGINTTTGRITGITGSTPGISHLAVTATDTSGASKTLRFDLTVAGAGTVIDDFADSVSDTTAPIGEVSGSWNETGLALFGFRRGSIFEGELETKGDRDWFDIFLRAGVKYNIILPVEGTLGNPYLRLYKSDGTTLLDQNDNLAPSDNSSRLIFAPATSDFYFIEAGASGDSLTGTYSLYVAIENRPPVVAHPIADRSTGENSAFSFTVGADTFADPDLGDTNLAYSAVKADGAALPAWLAFDATTRTFSGTPGNADVGVLNVLVIGSDSQSLSGLEEFALTINNTNDAPVPGFLAPRSVGLNQSVSLKLGDLFTDADVGDVLSFIATGLPSGFVINATTGVISGTAPATTGAFHIAVTATDNHATSASLAFDLSIVNGVPLVASVTTRGTVPAAVALPGVTANEIVGTAPTGNQLSFDTAGQLSTVVPDGNRKFSFSRGITDLTTNGKPITAADALDALKLSVGLDASKGSSWKELISADINQSGSVTAADALEILKMSVGINTIQPAWIFVPTDAGVNPNLAAMTRSTVKSSYTSELDLATGSGPFAVTGILLGDVNNSWLIPT
ncbi:MAG: putative Ig domain-containing protein [Burkholderiales bacterium]